MVIIEVCSKVKQTGFIKTMLPDTSAVIIQELTDSLLKEKQIRLSILRLDKIHAVVSGNKLFKLHYFLEEATAQNLPIITYGGAYSNHLVATAYACKLLSIPCTGVVRGEEPARWSHTLIACKNLGMELTFVSRMEYGARSVSLEHPGYFVIPEGGYHPLGAKGASLILQCMPTNAFTHICTATGTATTLAGLLLSALPQQRVLSYAALKGLNDIPTRLQFLTGQERFHNLELINDYHWGGYAKHTEELLQFMNDLHSRFSLPTDFVYTAKMMFGIFQQVKQGFFPAGSNVLGVHTGGLQGNLSLPKGMLDF